MLVGGCLLGASGGRLVFRAWRLVVSVWCDGGNVDSDVDGVDDVYQCMAQITDDDDADAHGDPDDDIDVNGNAYEDGW